MSTNNVEEKFSVQPCDDPHKMSDENAITVELLCLNKEEEASKIVAGIVASGKKEETYLKSNSSIKLRFYAQLEHVKAVQGYIYGIMFAFSMCMANILVKMAPSLDGGNHACIRYFIQLIFMSVFIRRNHLSFFGPPSQRKLLIFRGFTGSVAIILSFFAIRYLDVSDVETITNSNVLITAIFSRVFLSEKMTISHIVALVLNITGVIFVLRPSFLFGIEHDMEKIFHVNLTTSSSSLTMTKASLNLNNSLTNLTNLLSKHKSTAIIDHSNREMFESVLGVCLVLLSASAMSISHVAVRKLSLEKIHFSVSSIYPAFVGLPFSIIISIVLILTKNSHVDLDDEASSLPLQIFYSICGGSIGVIGLTFLNIALNHEDPTKIGMTKTTGVLFSFILQYIFIGISIDFLGIIGAALVILAIAFVMLIKLFDKRLNSSKSCCLRLLATKF